MLPFKHLISIHILQCTPVDTKAEFVRICICKQNLVSTSVISADDEISSAFLLLFLSIMQSTKFQKKLLASAMGFI